MWTSLPINRHFVIKIKMLIYIKTRKNNDNNFPSITPKIMIAEVFYILSLI